MLFFSKGGETKRVMFLHVDEDGFKLDAKHDTPIGKDDLPLMRNAYKGKAKCLKQWDNRDTDKKRKNKWWVADREEIVENDYNLLAPHYRPIQHADIEHENTIELIDELFVIEKKIREELTAPREELTVERSE